MARTRPAAIATILDSAAERHPDRPVLNDRPPDVDPTRSPAMTYASWAAFVHEASGWLKAAGVEPWDRVAIMKGNHSDIIVLSCAAARIGAIPAHLAWTHPPQVAQTLLSRLDRPVLVTDRARLESCALDDDMLSALTKRTIVVDGDPEDANGGPAVALASLRGAGVPAARPRRDDEPMVITHTSGTTGVPKLVAHSANTIGAISRFEARGLPVVSLHGYDRVAFCDPYFHVRLVTGLVGVAKVCPKLVLMSDPEPSAAREMLVRHRPTIVETVPNAFLHWEPLVEDAAEPFRDVRLFFNTYDAIHARTVRRFLEASRRRFPVWIQAWGQSESGPVTMGIYTRRSVRRGRRVPITQEVGWPVSLGTRVRAVHPETLKPLPRGAEGIIEVRRDPCLDYVGERERYLSKRRDGWWNMGDMGRVRRSGGVRLVDREVDRIPGASGIELEDVLLDRLPQLTEAIVLPVDGGLPVPVVSTSRGEPLDEAAWEDATADLPPLAEPVTIPWDEFPRTATWKVQRPKLRDRVVPGTEAVGSGRWT